MVRKAKKYYRVGKGYRIHGYYTNKQGKKRYGIVGYEGIPEDLREYRKDKIGKKGEFRIVEWTVNFIPTRDSRPSSPRNWEVKIQLPDGYDKDDVLSIAKDVLTDLTNEFMVDSSTIEWKKQGKDIITYSDKEEKKWRVIDNARPQYKYPSKQEWGDYEE